MTAGLATLVWAAAAPSAAAQFIFHWWDEPVYVERYAPEFMSRGEVRAMLRARRLALRGPIRRNGRVYVVDVRDRRGGRARLIIDGVEGRIVQRFVDSMPPRPPRNIGRRYSHRVAPDWRDDEAGSLGARGHNPYFEQPRPAEPAVRSGRKSSKSKGKARAGKIRRGPAVVRRTLAPPAARTAPPNPAPAKSAPVKSAPAKSAPANQTPAAATVVPASKPVVRRSSPVPGIAMPKPVAPQITAPPQTAPITTAARPDDKDAAPGNPSVRFVKPKRQGKQPAGRAATPDLRSILPPPALPAKVKVPVERKAQRNIKPRVPVSPLDDPGKRRDAQKPVAVAPLQ